jgi:hypothetical protein
MEAKEYKRWALDGLREKALARGISVSGRRGCPRLLLRQSEKYSIHYQERWWRSAFKRSGYGGSLSFQSDRSDDAVNPTVVMLINLGDFFISARSPKTALQIDHFLDRLVQLADWCVSEKLEEFRELAEMSGNGFYKSCLAATLLREFPLTAWDDGNWDVD